MQLTPKKFTVPLTPKQKQQLNGLGELLPDDFSDLVYRINDTGRKVMLVSDHPGSVISAGELFAGSEKSTFHNVLEYALTQAEEKVSTLYFVSWSRAVIERGRGNKADVERIRSANRIFLSRLLYMIGRLKPDVVILCGNDPYTTLFYHFVQNNSRHAFNMNRLLTGTAFEHEFQYLGTADIFRPCSWDPKHRNFGQLLGWIVKGWRQAINGYADYRVDVSETKFQYIDTIAKFDAFYEKLIAAKIVALDTEGSGLGRITSQLFCLQFAFNGQSGYFLPFDHPMTPFSASELDYIRIKLRDYFERGKSHYHIWQFGKYDITQLYANLGIRYYTHRVYDTMAARWALDENLKGLRIFGVKPNSLEYMTECDYNNDIYQTIEFSKGERATYGKEGFTERSIKYGIYDAVVIYQIHTFQRQEATSQSYDKFLRYVTVQLGDKIIALAQMEFTGAPIDKRQIYKLASNEGPVARTIAAMEVKFKASPQAQKVNAYLLSKTARSKGDLFGETQWVFDLKKAECKEYLFFKAHKLEALKLNADGTGSTDKAFIAHYKSINPDVHAFAEWTKANTIRDNFVKVLLKKIQSDSDTLKDGRVRSFYTYTVVVGGRLSSTEPNLQNLPNRDDKTFSESFAKELKAAFIAEKFCLIHAADFSANEVREWANESGETGLADSFFQGMQMRREIRLHAYDHPQELASWNKFKADTGWDKIEKKEVDGKTISVHAQKLVLLKRLNNPDTQKFGALEIELAIAGDIHIQNCSRFFGVDPLDVTPTQRHDIKAVVFGVLYGKCQVFWARIPTTYGLFNLKELFKAAKPYECEDLSRPTFRALNVGVPTHEGLHNTQKVYRTMGRTMSVKTDYGDVLEGKPEHKVWIYRKEAFHFIPLSDIEIGDWVPKSVGTRLFAKKIPSFDQSRYRFENQGYEIPRIMNECIATLFGWMVAEGDRHGKFHNKDENALRFFVNGLHEEFNVRCEIKQYENYSSKVVQLPKSLNAFFCFYLGDVKSAKRFIPQIIRRSPEIIQRAFLQALWEGDGSIWCHQDLWLLEYTTISKTLAYDIKAMLENMGVLCAIDDNRTAWAANGSENQTRKPKYMVRVLTTHFAEFRKRVGFVAGGSKQRMLAEAVACIETGSFRALGRANQLPIGNLLLKLYLRMTAVCRDTEYTYLKKNRWGSTMLCRQRYKLGAVMGSSHKILAVQRGKKSSREDIVHIRERIAQAPDALRIRLMGDHEIKHLFCEIEALEGYYWGRIISKSKLSLAEKPVYDLTVPGPESYHCNGMISHNTAMGLSKSEAEGGLGKAEEYCQGLINKMFEEFKQGDRWVKEMQTSGYQNLFIESPLGMRRHLWSYLHTRPAFINAMHRRGPNCVDEETECLTTKGWRRYNQLRVGDKIFTKNVQTGDLELQPITALTISDHNGPMYRLDGSIDALTTMNHRWLIDKKIGRAKVITPTFVDSAYLLKSKNNNPIHLTADCAMVREGTNIWTDAEVSFIGWFVTDGNYSKTKGRTPRVRLSQSIIGNPHKVDIIDSVMTSLNSPFHKSAPNTLGHIRWSLYQSVLSHKILAAFPDKILTPRFLGELSTKQLRLLYDAMMLGNGNYIKREDRYADFGAGTYEKASMFSMLCVLLGISHRISPIKPAIAVKKYESMPNIPQQTKTFWVVRIKRLHRAQPMFYGSQVAYSGKVWCPTVENGTFVARRRGSVYITGNSSIQGTASEIGVTTMRLLQWIYWHFFTKHNVKTQWKSVTNYVHDAAYSHVPIPFLPIYAYMYEHASTTLVHRYYAKQFGYNLIIGIEGEAQIGANLARTKKWNFTDCEMLDQVVTEIKFQRETFGYAYTPQQENRMIKGLQHNAKIIGTLRREELKQEFDAKNRVAKIMLLNEGNARNLGIYHGMDLFA